MVFRKVDSSAIFQSRFGCGFRLELNLRPRLLHDPDPSPVVLLVVSIISKARSTCWRGRECIKWPAVIGFVQLSGRGSWQFNVPECWG